MKKNFYQKNFNKVEVNLIIGVILIALAIIFKIFIGELPSKLGNLKTDISYFTNIILTLGIINFILSIMLLSIEVYKRIKYDSWINLVKSIVQTFKIRKFLRQDETYIDTNFSNKSKNVKVNVVLKNFNKSIKYCIVDIRNNDVIVIFKIPRSQQSQKLLKDMKQQLLDEITYLNEDYYFSSIQRKKNYMYIKGNKR